MAKLVLTRDGRIVDQHFVTKAVTTIGREIGNDIVINDAQVSRAHARVLRVGEDDVIEDLRSGNGTYINGEPVSRQLLQHQDVVTIGAHQLRYMNTRTTGDADLERTMLIRVVPPQPLADADVPVVAAVPTARSGRPAFARGSVVILAAPGDHGTGEQRALDAVVTTFGTAGGERVVLTRRPQGIFLARVTGTDPVRVNHVDLGDAPQLLRHGDEIEAAGYRLRFVVGV